MSTQDSTDESCIDCPTCDRDDFKTKRGMRQHHTMVHGEKISGVETTCHWCGADITVGRGKYERNEHNFCDRECSVAWQTDYQTGENNPSWAGGGVSVECHWCGEPFTKKRSLAERDDRHFCDRACLGQWTSATRRGENHPRWTDEPNPTSRGSSWRQQRLRAIKRARGRCELCGLSDSDHHSLYGRSIHVHHKTPFSVFGVEAHEEANELSNLIVVCHSCHWELEPISRQRSD